MRCSRGCSWGIFFVKTVDVITIGADHFSNTEFQFVPGSRMDILPLKPAGLKIYARLIARLQSDFSGTATASLDWNKSSLISLQVATSSSTPVWVDSGWIDVSSLFEDATPDHVYLVRKITHGTGRLLDLTLIMAYGP